MIPVRLLALIAVAAAEPAFSEIIVRQRVIVRVPVPRPAPAPAKWKERKGPRCMALNTIAGAAVSAPDSVDMILRGGARIRAELQSACPALDFYSGFYLVPTRDGRVCADRDSIHARSGGACQIERFRKLTPTASRRRP